MALAKRSTGEGPKGHLWQKHGCKKVKTGLQPQCLTGSNFIVPEDMVKSYTWLCREEHWLSDGIWQP